jgi:uncharacterized coiled-coil protein SlyX
LAWVGLTEPHTLPQATKEALEKRVSELEKTKLTLSEELAEEQLNAKTTKTQLENRVNKLRVPTTLYTHFTTYTSRSPPGHIQKQIHKATQAEETLKAENEALTKQVRRDDSRDTRGGADTHLTWVVGLG